MKTRLLDRAQVLGNRLTSDSEVHVVADAERIDPLFCSEERLAFVIPPFKSDIELRCRTFVPSSIDAASQDGRSLGLCVARLQLDGVDLPLSDQAAFEEGWHDLEVFRNQGHQRWSRGTAPLPSGTRLVVIEKAGRSYCWARQYQDPDPGTVASPQPTWAVLGGL